MGIDTDLTACWNAVFAAGLTDVDAVCVLVSDPEPHRGAWAYPISGVTLMSDFQPWGVLLAHELGHMIADLGDEYPCYACFRTGNYPASSDWNRAFDPESAVIDNPNLGTDLTSLPWPTSTYLLEEPTEDNPTSNLNAYRGQMVGAWQGGGTYRTGVWRSEEYCIMDVVMNHWNEFFCGVCTAALDAELTGCFAIFPNDCLAISAEDFPPTLLSDKSVLPKKFTLPPETTLEYFDNRISYHLDMMIPPLWKIPEEVLGPMDLPFPPEIPDPPFPGPLDNMPTQLTFRNLPAGAMLTVFDQNDAIVAQTISDASRQTTLQYNASTLMSYRVSLALAAPNQAVEVSVDFSIAGFSIPLR
jgi:hypothetical protein